MDNKLSIIVKESGLEETKAQVLLKNFNDYFFIASDWEKKAKTIIVLNEGQKAEMQMARAGRLFLRKKRIAIEKTRKELKEQSLREGKAIDGIANVLKALIIPIEEHLEKQEKYIEIKMAEEAEQKRIEEEAKAEEERIAKEKAEEAERKRIRIENERLKKEAEERERKMAAERAKAEKEKREQEDKARKEREEADRILREERERRERELAAEKEKAEKERIRVEKEKKAHEEKNRKEKELAENKAREEREEVERKARIILEKREKEIAAEKAAREARLITCPFCHKSFSLNQKEKK